MASQPEEELEEFEVNGTIRQGELVWGEHFTSRARNFICALSNRRSFESEDMMIIGVKWFTSQTMTLKVQAKSAEQVREFMLRNHMRMVEGFDSHVWFDLEEITPVRLTPNQPSSSPMQTDSPTPAQNDRPSPPPAALTNPSSRSKSANPISIAPSDTIEGSKNAAFKAGGLTTAPSERENRRLNAIIASLEAKSTSQTIRQGRRYRTHSPTSANIMSRSSASGSVQTPVTMENIASHPSKSLNMQKGRGTSPESKSTNYFSRTPSPAATFSSFGPSVYSQDAEIQMEKKGASKKKGKQIPPVPSSLVEDSEEGDVEHGGGASVAAPAERL
ncbi:hypothetical protein HDV00_008883 [Rhizophlyctis rosea]|nr:hypothetical protein HDV00_008883 [Rhizophlyctis rosea]